MMWKGLAVSTRSTTDHELIEMDDLVSRFFEHMTKAQQPKRLTVEEIERLADEAGYEMAASIASGRIKENPRPIDWIAFAIRYARDQGYIGGLTVDEAMEVARKADKDWHDYYDDEEFWSDLRARFTSKHQGHQDNAL